MESNLTKSFRTNHAAITYAETIERSHDVDVRCILGRSNPYRVYVDADTCYTEGFRIYTNLGTN
jgi:hypothetical protein